MGLLILGLILFTAPHLALGLFPANAGAFLERRGKNARSAVVALLSFAGIGLIVLGWRQSTATFLYDGPPALYTVAATVILSMPFNFANVIVLPLLMGLGVANGIHLVSRSRQEKSGAAAFATTTPRAVIFSSLTTIASFGSLAVSSHRGTASMGELLMLSIGLTLLCTLVVLPSLMRLWPAPRTGGQETD